MKTIKTLLATATLIGGLAASAPAFAVDEYNDSLITEDMLESVETARQAIIGGEIDVPTE